MFISIDDYYSVDFYNECLNALDNNKVDYNQYMMAKPPYHFVIEVDSAPTFINYDEVPKNLERFLINLTQPLKESDRHLFLRRESVANKKAINQYAMNDAFRQIQKTKECIFFTAKPSQVQEISRKYPRKIYYFGKYYGRKYRVFAADSMMIKNHLDPDQILVQSDKFNSVTELELELNYKVFMSKDKLTKIADTPYLLNGSYSAVATTRPDLTDKFTL